jgi:hypothetical protein
MPRPVRLQLSRRKGFNLQTHSRAYNGLEAVNVARPGKWGNPFIVGQHGKRDYCVALFIHMFEGLLCISVDHECVEAQKAYPKTERMFKELKGKNLACWCHAGPCHADVLLELANK